MRYIYLVLIALCNILPSTITAQDSTVQLSTRVYDSVGNYKKVRITATPAKGITIISIRNVPVLNVQSSIVLDSTTNSILTDSVQEIGNGIINTTSALKEYNITTYKDSVVWQYNALLKGADIVRFKATINYSYIQGDAINTGSAAISKQLYANNSITSTKQSYNSLWALLIAGIGFGLLGFLTPCVYALVPVTVSMFLKRSKTKREGKVNIFAYAFFIIIIYTSIGLLTGSLFSVNDLQNLSTHWLFNTFIFILFVIFGVSFLGAFDINLPSSWANKLDSKANTKSFTGIFFMAFTLVIVSFSCTSIFVSNILATSSVYFGKLGPVVGMFSFGLGLGLPFMLLALFPSFLTSLTKSGGWQNALKVTLGFLELALALKFLLNVDAYFKWSILDREVFLVIWIALFALLTLYLIGKLRFKHDSHLPKNDWGLEYVPVPRLLLAVASLAFTLYLIPGLWGAPLNAISGFTPPYGSQDFTITAPPPHASVASTVGGTTAALPPSKYVAQLKENEPKAAKDNQFITYYDYDEAMAAAKILKKPLLIDFTGEQCVNCRKFEASIWKDADVARTMKNDFVLASLYTDAKIELNDTEKKYDSLLQTTLYNVGDKFKALQLKLINSQAQPNYVILDNNANLLQPNGYGYEATENAKAFYNHLQAALVKYKSGM